MSAIHIYTIGFAQTSAEEFFTTLRQADVARIVDVRLNNTSQLAAFAKQQDLPFFLRELVGIEYVHVPQFTPTQEMLDAYKKAKGTWTAYERDFRALLRKRKVETSVSKTLVDRGCLLCSEHSPEHCHRRVVAEYLQSRWGNVEIVHLPA